MEQPSHLLGEQTAENSDLICVYVFLAAELKEKLQSEMEKNVRMIEVDVVRNVTLCMQRFPFVLHASSLPPTPSPGSPQETPSPDSDKIESFN